MTTVQISATYEAFPGAFKIMYIMTDRSNKSQVLKQHKTYKPETQSTTTRAPSVTLKAAVTSDEKSTWPGESIKLIKKSFLLSGSFCWVM